MKFSMSEHGFTTETSFGSLDISSNDAHGFRPFQLLVSSVAVCSGGVLRNILQKMRMPASAISIDAKEIKRNPDEANKVEKIHLHFTIEGQNLSTSKMDRAFELTHKNCSIVQSVSPAIEVIKTYEIKQTSQ